MVRIPRTAATLPFICRLEEMQEQLKIIEPFIKKL